MLEAVKVDDVAADDERPAGLLHDVVPIAAGASMSEDVRNIGAAIAAGGSESDRMWIIAAPSQAIFLRLNAGPRFDYPIIGTNALADGTIVGVDPQAIASGYSGTPEITISKEGVAHFESATPAEIVTGAGVIAAPVLSAWQQDLLLLKLRTNCCWGVLMPGAVQAVAGCSW